MQKAKTKQKEENEMTGIDHPISIYYRKTGKSWEEAEDHFKRFFAQTEEVAWEKCRVQPNKDYGAAIEFNTSQHMFGLGEIGLAYLAYRLYPYVERRDALMYFRNGNFASLTTLLQSGLDNLRNFGLLQESYWATHIDFELMGFLTEYVSISNGFVLEMIREAGLEERLRKWVWTPTSASFYLRGGVVERKFHYGVRIANGETGHTALSFKSTLWSDGIDGFVYEFGIPLEVERGYARHLPSKKLTKVMGSLVAVMKENLIAEVFESFAVEPGDWGAKRIIYHLKDVEARDASKEKLLVSFEDEMIVNKPETALDAVVSLMECGSRINKSAAIVAQLTLSNFISKASLSKIEVPKGEVTKV